MNAQTVDRKSDSPVLRRNQRPVQIIPAPESDAIQKIWDAFLVARKAQEGDKFAQHELGLRYIGGRGVERDTAKAAYWFEQASNQGLIASRFNLAILRLHGWGCQWDPFVAYKLIRECAEAEMPEGMFMYGVLLTEDLTVPRNWDEAYQSAKKSSEAGFEPATHALPEFEARLSKKGKQGDDATLPVVAAVDSAGKNGDPKLLKDIFGSADKLRDVLGMEHLADDSAKVDTSSLHLVKRAALYGSPEALTVLGRCYERGIEVRRDSVEAAAQFVRALRFDSPRASVLLLAMLKKGSFVNALKTRTDRGDPVAEFVVAGLAGLGFESGVNEARAVVLMNRSAEGGYVPAIAELGLWHYAGRFVKEDHQLAKEFWHKAYLLGSMEASVRLAVMALRDSGDVRIHATQIALLRSAAAEGSLLADVALAFASEHGLGVRQDLGLAATTYRFAAARGSQDAYRALKRMYDEVRPDDAEYRMPMAN
jgi:TPR repeat protein